MKKNYPKIKSLILCLGLMLALNFRAQVTTQTFVYSGTIQSFTVPTGVTQLSVDARGAGGGSVTTCPAFGGLGARMFGVVTVTPGQVISILVGQAGGNSGSAGEGGGGGGSYVVTGTVPLVIAGGGGGASSNIGSCGSNLNGVNASTTTVGTFNASGVTAGGSAGNGGTGSGGSGGGGGGFLTNGSSSSNANGGGKSFLNGGAGGSGTSSNGGFGGGGCGWSTGGNGGGGGGYSGGGTYGASPYSGGGGGGSYNIGTNQINTAGFQSGNGLVILSYGPGGNSGGPLNSGSSTLTFTYTGSTQNFTVPSCVNTITFNVQGARGGSGSPVVSGGGNGGRVFGVMTVTPGQVLQLNVGGVGSAGSVSSPATGGFNGGGAGGYYSGSYGGGGGGGASDIRVSPYALANRMVVAGGGGGGAYNSSTTNYDRGGHGGLTTAEAGYSGNVSGGTAPGGAGSQSSGGIAGFWSGYCTATAGSLGNGGPGGTCTNSGGGGGGGYYGGGGGVWAGGGGGSSYTDPSITNVGHSLGLNTTSGSISFTLGVNGNLVNSVVATPTTLCAGNSATLSSSGLISYTWSSASGNISTASSVAITPSVSSNYTVMATNSVGCVSGYSIFVFVNSLPTITVNSGSICAGGVFTMVPSGGVSYTYAGGSSTVNPSSSNVYTVSGSNAAGCVAATAAISSVTVVALPVVSASSGTICTGSTYTIVPSGASTYTYSSGSSLVSPTSNTTYSVTGTSSVGCVSLPTPLTVSVSPLPTITVNSGGICSGKIFTITPSGAATYSINIGGSGTSFTVSPASATNYLINGTSAVGCVSSNSALSSVSVNATPTIAVSSGTICSNNSYSIVASGASTYTYSSGSAVVSPVSNTSYSVTGTSSLGCVGANTAVATVTVYTTPTIAVNSGQICIGQTFTMVPSGANTYTYSNGSATVSPISTSVYTVTGTSIQGCAAFNTVVSNVTVNPTPTITVNSGTLCSGNSFTINPSGAFSYSITGGLSVVSPSTNAVYFVTGTSALGCVGTNTAISTVTVYTSPVITVNSGSICSGSSFTMSPTGAVSYTYSNGSSTVSPLTNTSYSVVGSNSLGCTSNTVVSTVTVNITPTLSVNSGTICSGQTFTIVPSGAGTYSISGGSTTVSPSASSSYTVNGISAQGCAALSAVISTVVVNITPTITVNSGSICSGQTFTIVPSGASTYSITGGSATVSPLANSVYSVTGTSSLGCIGTGAAVSSVVVNPTPSITVNSGTICSGQSFTITPAGALTYTFTGGSAVVSPTSTSGYSVTGSNTFACVSQVAVSNVTVYALPVVSIAATRSVICTGESNTLTASGAPGYSWSAGATSSSISISPTVTTSYSVVGTSTDGCTATAVISQSVDACTGIKVSANSQNAGISIFPNPNNGKFEIRTIDQDVTFEIHNLMGQLVLSIKPQAETTEVNLGDLTNGVYFVRVINQNKVIASQKIVKQ